jgi:hypothetical protein
MIPGTETRVEIKPLEFLGFTESYNHPFKVGQEVFIPKGTPIMSAHPKDKDEHRGMFGELYHKVAKKNFTVVVHDICCGWNGYQRDDNGNLEPARNPSIIWAGPQGYWQEVDVNNLVNIPQNKA